MNEQELKKYNWLNPPTIYLPRSERVQRLYDQDIKLDTHKKFIHNTKQMVEKHGFLFIPNNYPYDVVEPIRHSCLWYKGSFTPEDLERFLELNNIRFITYFENDMQNKSIKSINHYHIFHY